jgi:Signal transduction histidine kinase
MGPVDLVITDSIADDIVAVAREALTNVVKHASAQHVSLVIGVADGFVSLRVSDDGVGAPDATRRSGLANLQKRALDRDGTFSFHSERGQTHIGWSVPVDQTAAQESLGAGS